MGTTLTTERLLTKAYERIAEAGLASNSGPDAQGTQMLLLYQDIIYSESIDDVVRADALLAKAQNYFGA
jgi:hypothetical protein